LEVYGVFLRIEAMQHGTAGTVAGVWFELGAEICDSRGSGFRFGNRVQRLSQPLLIAVAVRRTAKFVIPEDSQRTDLFTTKKAAQVFAP
jgi:hypothetical protein